MSHLRDFVLQSSGFCRARIWHFEAKREGVYNLFIKLLSKSTLTSVWNRSRWLLFHFSLAVSSQWCVGVQLLPYSNSEETQYLRFRIKVTISTKMMSSSITMFNSGHRSHRDIPIWQTLANLILMSCVNYLVMLPQKHLDVNLMFWKNTRFTRHLEKVQASC